CRPERERRYLGRCRASSRLGVAVKPNCRPSPPTRKLRFRVGVRNAAYRGERARAEPAHSSWCWCWAVVPQPCGHGRFPAAPASLRLPVSPASPGLTVRLWGFGGRALTARGTRPPLSYLLHCGDLGDPLARLSPGLAR